MPDASTPNLALPLLQAAQSQKHVTHNEALVALDTLVQLAVLDKDLTAPPASPAEGDRYLIAGTSPTGSWTGWAGRVVRYQDGAWRSFVPRPGWLAFVADEADLYTWTGAAWASFRSTLTALQNLTRLGLGTSADAQNPFAAKLNKALWTALATGEGGTGDLRYTLNKEAPGNTLSLLFQSGFSGRAELGLTGDDDLHLKVSTDGGTWREALRADRNTGGLDLTAAEVSAPVAATVDLGALPALKVALTGSGTITGFGTIPHRLRLLRFTGAATLTHNPASLVLPGGASLVTAAGDTALASSDAGGTWTVRHYQRTSGKPVAGPAAAEILDAGAAGLAVLTAADSGAAAAALGLGPSFRNRLRNAAFTVNQRAVSGTVTLAAGAYGHDGFKAGANGCTYTFARSGGVTTLTLSAGTLVQVIEGGLSMTEGGTYTASWLGTAFARLNGGAYAASPIVATGLAADADLTVEWGTGTLALPQVETGKVRTPFERRDDELRRCLRYFFSSYDGVAPGTANAGISFSNFFQVKGAYQTVFSVILPAGMRAVPSVTFYSPKSGAAGTGYANNAGADVRVYASANSRVSLTCTLLDEAQYGVQVNMTASAEL